MRLRYDASHEGEYIIFLEEERTAVVGPGFVRCLITLTSERGDGVEYMGWTLADLVDAYERGEIPDVLNIWNWEGTAYKDKLGKATFVLNIMRDVDTALMSDDEVFARMGAEGYRWYEEGKVWTLDEEVDGE